MAGKQIKIDVYEKKEINVNNNFFIFVKHKDFDVYISQSKSKTTLMKLINCTKFERIKEFELSVSITYLYIRQNRTKIL